MKAVVLNHPGGPELLKFKNIPRPKIESPTEMLVQVHATGLNRADIAQRKGMYPTLPGHSEILGLEIAGEVIGIGKDVKNFKVGDRVFGLVNGGGYAEYCLIEEAVTLPIPKQWTYEYAAAIPEVFITADETILELGNLKKGESILIHAGGSGVGTASIQLARHLGAIVYITAGTDEKISKALELGASFGINHTSHDFAFQIQTLTNGQGVDVIQDFVGANYLVRNLNCLKEEGRLILIALMGGAKTEINLGQMLVKRLQVKGTLLRTRSLEQKQAMTKRFQQRWLPLLEKEEIKPIIDYVFPIDMIQDAHRYLEGNRNFGKVVLKMG